MSFILYDGSFVPTRKEPRINYNAFKVDADVWNAVRPFWAEYPRKEEMGQKDALPVRQKAESNKTFHSAEWTDFREAGRSL